MPIDLARALGGGGAPEIWVSGKAYAQGDQAISPTDWGVYIRKAAGAGTTNPAADPVNWQPFGARAIRSIQRGTTTQSSGPITVAAVNVAKTELRLLSSANVGIKTARLEDYLQAGSGGGRWYWDGDNITLSLSSATALAISGNHMNKQVSWELTEYY